MQCHICAAEAAGRCRSCGLAFCGGDGAELCRGCATGILVLHGAPRAGARAFLQCVSKPRMPTVHLDDEGPPSCHQCGGLARRICENCQELYCPEHAGPRGWCESCTRAARSGLWMCLGVLLFLLAVGALTYLLTS
jgi:hypothetical protein